MNVVYIFCTVSFYELNITLRHQGANNLLFDEPSYKRLC